MSMDNTDWQKMKQFQFNANLKQYLWYTKCQRFLYDNPIFTSKILSILRKDNSKPDCIVSLRLLHYICNEFKGQGLDKNGRDKLAAIRASYSAHMDVYGKRYFDPFRRNDRCLMTISRDNDAQLETTIGQMDFFMWAKEVGLLPFAEKYITTILSTMTEELSKARELQAAEEPLVEQEPDHERVDCGANFFVSCDKNAATSKSYQKPNHHKSKLMSASTEQVASDVRLEHDTGKPKVDQEMVAASSSVPSSDGAKAAAVKAPRAKKEKKEPRSKSAGKSETEDDDDDIPDDRIAIQKSVIREGASKIANKHLDHKLRLSADFFIEVNRAYETAMMALAPLLVQALEKLEKKTLKSYILKQVLVNNGLLGGMSYEDFNSEYVMKPRDLMYSGTFHRHIKQALKYHCDAEETIKISKGSTAILLSLFEYLILDLERGAFAVSRRCDHQTACAEDVKCALIAANSLWTRYGYKCAYDLPEGEPLSAAEEDEEEEQEMIVVPNKRKTNQQKEAVVSKKQSKRQEPKAETKNKKATRKEKQPNNAQNKKKSAPKAQKTTDAQRDDVSPPRAKRTKKEPSAEKKVREKKVPAQVEPQAAEKTTDKRPSVPTEQVDEGNAPAVASVSQRKRRTRVQAPGAAKSQESNAQNVETTA